MKRTVLVTGAFSGIGKATALKLLHEGYCVYASARNLDKLKFLAAQAAKVLELDVTQDRSMQGSVGQIIGKLLTLASDAMMDALMQFMICRGSVSL